jgi:hypothetical protein
VFLTKAVNQVTTSQHSTSLRLGQNHAGAANKGLMGNSKIPGRFADDEDNDSVAAALGELYARFAQETLPEEFILLLDKLEAKIACHPAAR